MLYYRLTKRLSKVPISPTSGIIINSGVWHSGVVQAHTKVLEIRKNRCKVRSMDKHPWSGEHKVHDMSLTMVPRVSRNKSVHYEHE